MVTLGAAAVACFKISASAPGPGPSYLHILETHATPCEPATTARPDVIPYEDPAQVIAQSGPVPGS